MNKCTKRQKATHITCLTAEQLRDARTALGGLSQAEMAQILQTPLRTYQEWEGGRRRIPGVAAVAVRLLQERDRGVMAVITEQINAAMDRDSRFVRRQS